MTARRSARGTPPVRVRHCCGDRRDGGGSSRPYEVRLSLDAVEGQPRAPIIQPRPRGRDARADDGRLRLTFEIIHGHAFKAEPRRARGDSQAVSVDEMRAMLRDRKP